MRISNLVYALSQFLLILAAAFLPSLALSAWDGDGVTLVFAVQAALMAGLGLLFRRINLRPREVTIREGFLLVSGGWAFIALCGALPFVFSGYVPRLADACFETMSGFTTTGATILADIERLPRSLLLWRSMTHWLGGMGVIAIAVALFPFFGIGGFQLFKTESPGPIKSKLVPRVSDTAKILWRIYIGMTAVEAVLLLPGGVPPFEAVCISFATMATGGFATRNASIAAYPSAYVHYVIVVFMFLAGANFTLHFLALKGKPGSYLKDPEFRFYAAVIACATAVVLGSRLLNGALPDGETVRGALFQVVSIVTTTGFITQDYDAWPWVAQCTLLLLMFLGGCASSTGGAIKHIRVLAMLKQIGAETRKLLVPHSVTPVRLGGKPLEPATGSAIMTFICLYLLTFLFGFFGMLSVGLDPVSATGAVAAALGNVGPGLGVVGATDNYRALPEIGKWLLSLLMLAGRLELFPIFILFRRSFWR